MTNCLFFGDSIVYGEYDGILGGWVDNLKRFCHEKYYNHNAKEVNIFNLGIGGETTEGLLKRFDVEFSARKSPFDNLIFLSYGANDLAIKDKVQIVSKENYKKNMKNVILQAKQTTDKIYLVSILPTSSKIDGVIVSSGKLRTIEMIKEYNNVLKLIAEENGVEYIDTYSAFFDNKEECLSKDSVHPNEKGYQLISEYVKPIIEKYL
jgi:lysophospholipase L1-like esterase